VRIQGSPDIHVNQGSLINLTCIISYSPEPPAFIFWYRGDEVSVEMTFAGKERMEKGTFFVSRSRLEESHFQFKLSFGKFFPSLSGVFAPSKLKGGGKSWKCYVARHQMPLLYDESGRKTALLGRRQSQVGDKSSSSFS